MWKCYTRGNAKDWGNMGEEGINSRNVSAMGVQGEVEGAALEWAGGMR